VRGTIGGKGDLTMDAITRVSCPVQPSYAVSQRASHTLQNGDRERAEARRAKLIEATVEAIAEGSHPRLVASRSWP
jgi:hypothetical protein